MRLEEKRFLSFAINFGFVAQQLRSFCRKECGCFLVGRYSISVVGFHPDSQHLSTKMQLDLFTNNAREGFVAFCLLLRTVLRHMFPDVFEHVPVTFKNVSERCQKISPAVHPVSSRKFFFSFVPRFRIFSIRCFSLAERR